MSTAATSRDVELAQYSQLESYLQFSEKGRSSQELAYHIFQNHTDIALSKIESLKQTMTSSSSPLRTQFTPMKLGLIHLATIKRNETILKALLEAGGHDDINRQDDFGWTAMHHAALHSDRKMIEILRAYRPDETIMNKDGGTWLHIWEMAHPPTTSPESQVTHFWDCEKQMVVRKNGADFQRFTGKIFTDRVLTSRKLILANWFGWCPLSYEPVSIDKRINKQYEAFLKQPPILCHTNELSDDRGQPAHFRGSGVCAGVEIAPGQIFCPYEGEELSPEEEARRLDQYGGGDYLFSLIDAQRYCGYGGLINDGFPNCVVIEVHHHSGKMRRLVFMAIEKILPGQPIYWDYRSHPIKLNAHFEPRPRAIEDFVQGRNFTELLAHFSSLSPYGLLDSPHLKEILQCKYLANTQSSCIPLLLAGKISSKDYTRLLKFSDRPENEKNDIKATISQFILIMNSLDPAKAKVIKNWFIEKFQTGNYTIITLCMKAFNTKLKHQEILSNLNDEASIRHEMHKFYLSEIKLLRIMASLNADLKYALEDLPDLSTERKGEKEVKNDQKVVVSSSFRKKICRDFSSNKLIQIIGVLLICKLGEIILNTMNQQIRGA